MFLQNQMLKIGKIWNFPFVSVEFCISLFNTQHCAYTLFRFRHKIILGWGEQSIMVGLKMVTKQRMVQQERDKKLKLKKR